MEIPELSFLVNLATWLITAYPLLFSSIGWYLAHVFATNTNGTFLDDAIREHGNLKGFSKWFVDKLLHFIHHYYLGAIGFYLTNPWVQVDGLPHYPCEVLAWFFFGIFVEDGQYHLRKFIGAIQPTK